MNMDSRYSVTCLGVGQQTTSQTIIVARFRVEDYESYNVLFQSILLIN